MRNSGSMGKMLVIHKKSYMLDWIATYPHREIYLWLLIISTLQ